VAQTQTSEPGGGVIRQGGQAAYRTGAGVGFSSAVRFKHDAAPTPSRSRGWLTGSQPAVALRRIIAGIGKHHAPPRVELADAGSRTRLDEMPTPAGEASRTLAGGRQKCEVVPES
jgi:hypothetical protein